jgi:dephospho-CoA kinase
MMPQGDGVAKLRGGRPGVAAVGGREHNSGVSFIIGLTGGIGSGKSTVAGMLAERGAVHIDADRVAHEVYAPGTEGHDLLVDRFGDEIVAEDGAIDRRRLGAQVFGDQKALTDLNSIIHPLVRKEIARRLIEAVENDPSSIVVIEAALMTEIGWAGERSTMWTVIAEPETVTRRLVGQRGMDPQDVRLRLAAQATNDERRRISATVIDNEGSVIDLEAQVDRAWRELIESLDR